MTDCLTRFAILLVFGLLVVHCSLFMLDAMTGGYLAEAIRDCYLPW